MFDSQRISLFDGAHVRLAIVGHPKPIFYADASHGGFNVAGYMYYRDGTPVDPKAPAVVEIVRYQ